MTTLTTAGRAPPAAATIETRRSWLIAITALGILSVSFSATPIDFASEHVERLRRAGLAIADVIHAAAFFNWANRLMLSLGEPAVPAEA
jgi:alkylhydroperoxidase family enzyme